jgi:lysophospholipase L1-like esterase
MDSILAAKPKRAFIMIGVNDALEEKTTVGKTLTNYKTIINLLVKENISVVITSTSPCNRVINSKCTYGLPKIIEINKQLKNVAASYHIPYLDLATLLSGKDGLDAIYSDDGIHFNLKAYKIWVSLLAPYVLS